MAKFGLSWLSCIKANASCGLRCSIIWAGGSGGGGVTVIVIVSGGGVIVTVSGGGVIVIVIVSGGGVIVIASGGAAVEVPQALDKRTPIAIIGNNIRFILTFFFTLLPPSLLSREA